MSYVICPICSKRIDLANKDWESASLREYAEHVAALHDKSEVKVYTGSDFGIPYAIVMEEPKRRPRRAR